MKGYLGYCFEHQGAFQHSRPLLYSKTLAAGSLIVLATDSYLLSHHPVRTLARIATLLYLTGRPLDESVFDRDEVRRIV
jgi:hypothetical protein